jgi:hypothetical protein
MYREETGLKRAVRSVWRTSHGALPGQACAHHIGGNKFYIFWVIIFDNVKKMMYKINAHFGALRNESLTLPWTRLWHPMMCHFSRWNYTKYFILSLQKMSRFPLIKKKFREIPLISPKNGHPSCRLGFDSSDVKARRGSTRSNLVKPRPQAGTPLGIWVGIHYHAILCFFLLCGVLGFQWDTGSP